MYSNVYGKDWVTLVLGIHRGIHGRHPKPCVQDLGEDFFERKSITPAPRNRISDLPSFTGACGWCCHVNIKYTSLGRA